MKINYKSYLPGFLIWILWIASMASPFAGNFIGYFVIQSLFMGISIFNTVLFFNETSTRQLFYSDSSVLARTLHAHRRQITSGAPRTWRSEIGDSLRGYSTEKKENQGKKYLDVIEIDLWDQNETTEGIFIFLSPLTVFLSIIVHNLGLVILFSVAFVLFMSYLLNFVRNAIEDQKIIGEELFKTQSRAIRPRLEESSLQDYSNRVIRRKSNYRDNMPKYGPGADLKGVLSPGSYRESDYSSEYEYSESNNNERGHSPSWLTKVRNSSLVVD